MKILSCFFVAVLISCAYAQSGIAIIKGNALDSGITGYVTFTPNAQDPSLVDVFVNVTGMTVNPDAQHGIHVHTYGDISLNNGSSVASHFNPADSPHGCPELTDNRHLGDMGNWNASAGSIVQTKTLDLLTLIGVNSVIGRAVVVHQNVDDCSVTTSSAGRLAQGVIGIANVAGNTASNGLTNATKAICVLAPISDAPAGSASIGGYAIIQQGTGNPQVLVVLTGVDDVVRAVHIHQTGDISNMASVGAHWNASGDNVHGVYDWPHHHTGDLGNVYYFDPSNSNNAYFSQSFNPSFGLNGVAPNFIGHALVVHANRDNCSSPSGASGSRVASCVWGLTDLSFSAYLSPAYPPTVSVPETYDTQTQLDCNATFGSHFAVTTAHASSASKLIQSIFVAVSIACSFLLF